MIGIGGLDAMSFRDEFHTIVRQYNDEGRIEACEKLKDKLSSKPVVLFGAALIGDFVYDRLVSWGIKPACFADNFAVDVSPHGHGPILKPEVIKEQFPDPYIILTLDRAKEQVYRQLLRLGFSDSNIIQDNQLLITPMEMESFDPFLIGYEWAYDFFEDQISKQIVLERIKCYLMGSEVQKSDSPQYFEKGLFPLSDEEVFVDGGFFTGDTTEEFIRQTNGHYRMIYGFEPDKFVRDKLSSELRKENIQIIPAGLYTYTGTIQFATTSGSSTSSGGNIIGEVSNQSDNIITIPTVSLDDFFSEKPPQLQPTLIKMDIEGSEKAALEGAERTIRTQKPKLAICVYHKPEDIYELPQLLWKMCPSYQFALRHYAHYFWETVLYAY